MTLAFNQQAGIPATIVCTGNTIAGRSDRQMESSVLAGLEATLRLPEESQVTLLLEPLNTHYNHPGYWLTSSDRRAEICRKFQSPRLRLLFDCYHMQVMEGNLCLTTSSETSTSSAISTAPACPGATSFSEERPTIPT